MTTTEKPDVQNVRMPVRYDLNDAEIADEARKLAALTRVREKKEREFKQLQKQWKSDDERLELEINEHRDRIESGWDMRAADCTVTYNDPEKGKKTIRREVDGSTVSVEQMGPLDQERELPLPPEERKAIAREIPRDDQLPLDGSLNAANNEGLGTNLGDALGASAAKTDQPQVVLPDWDKDDWGAKSLRAAFKKAAEKALWPKVAIETLLSQCKGSDVAAIRATLAPHVKGVVVMPVHVEGVGEATLEISYQERWGDFNGTHHLSIWGPLDPLIDVMIQQPPEMHESQKIISLSNDLNNSAMHANWPNAAKNYLEHCIDGATLDELVALAERLKGSEVQP